MVRRGDRESRDVLAQFSLARVYSDVFGGAHCLALIRVLRVNPLLTAQEPLERAHPAHALASAQRLRAHPRASARHARLRHVLKIGFTDLG